MCAVAAPVTCLTAARRCSCEQNGMITSRYESVEWMDIRVFLGGSVKVNIKFKIGVFGFIVKVGCADAPWNVRPREPKVQSKGPNQQDTYSRGDCEG